MRVTSYSVTDFLGFPQPAPLAKEAMRYFTPEKISERQEMTPEGFLLCRDVPIARTGVMYYAHDEVPIEPGSDPYIEIYRDEDEVFRPETLASFVGKPVTNNHPPENVDPENFKQHIEGIIIRAARGEGINDKYIMADLLIMGKDAISAIRDGKREVSAGYNADYEELKPGRGRQTNIIGNHVALVDQGRCGPSCAIGDRRTDMPTPKRQTFFDCVRAAFENKDQAALEKILKDFPNENVENGAHLHVHNNTSNAVPDKDKETSDRLTRIEDALAKLVGAKDKKVKDKDDEDEDDTKTDDTGEDTGKMAEVENCDGDDEDEDDKKEKKTGDAATHYRLWQDTSSRAELIAPGFRVPTFDAAEKSTVRFKDMLCTCKRKILDKAYETDNGKMIIEPLLQGKKAAFDKMPADALSSLFVSVSEVYRASNNKRAPTSDNSSTHDAFKKGGLDKLNRSFWDNRKPKN